MITRLTMLGALLAIGTANAATISFAADVDPTQPSLLSQFDAVNTVTNVTDMGPTFTMLLVDPQDGGPVSAFNANLTVDFDLVYQSTVETGPGVFAHYFSLNGIFEFFDADTNDFLLRGVITDSVAAMVALGTSTIIQSGFISGFEIEYELGSIISGITGFGQFSPGDFGFTLTDLNQGDGAVLLLENGVVVGIDAFDARASFSGTIIPTPGAIALFAMTGLISIRRRR
ncbi:MAG: hypothetical protein EA379_01955 [Phycisphaerales bacterium]|jgi:hypothetical protein|nr:MAG: hypothetical protein EA379_01955 [Phycisphaerales bacterium]